MSDPTAFVPYEPNARPAGDAPHPLSGDPSRLQAAIADLLNLEPWQRRLIADGALDPAVVRTVHPRERLLELHDAQWTLSRGYLRTETAGSDIVTVTPTDPALAAQLLGNTSAIVIADEVSLGDRPDA